jgi:nucleoid DNA-binding protein
LADSTGLTKKQVAGVLDELKAVINGHIKKGSAQTFTMPGLLKVKVNRKPATRARKGTNPFTGEEMMFKAKPARNVVKILPLKALKDMAL